MEVQDRWVHRDWKSNDSRKSGLTGKLPARSRRLELALSNRLSIVPAMNGIRKYYDSRDNISLQRAQELVTELDLTEGKVRGRHRTKRYVRLMERADVHHDPSPGLASLRTREGHAGVSRAAPAVRALGSSTATDVVGTTEKEECGDGERGLFLVWSPAEADRCAGGLIGSPSINRNADGCKGRRGREFFELGLFGGENVSGRIRNEPNILKVKPGEFLEVTTALKGRATRQKPNLRNVDCQVSNRILISRPFQNY